MQNSKYRKMLSIISILFYHLRLFPISVFDCGCLYRLTYFYTDYSSILIKQL